MPPQVRHLVASLNEQKKALQGDLAQRDSECNSLDSEVEQLQTLVQDVSNAAREGEETRKGLAERNAEQESDMVLLRQDLASSVENVQATHVRGNSR